MLEIYASLIPVFAWFLFGVVIRQLGWVNEMHGAMLLKFTFFVSLPVLIFIKITEADIQSTHLYLPVINVIINLCCLSIMYLITRGKQINRQVLGVMLTASAITNNFFSFPFIHAVLGDEALVNAIMFDLGNALSTLTIVYIIAFSHGPEQLRFKKMVMNVCKLPALWALTFALSFNYFGVRLPSPLLNVLEPFGLLTNIFILISLGIYFTLKIPSLGLTIMTVGIRMAGGLLVSVLCVWLFRLEGVAAMIVIICGAAPIGFNGLTYSSLARLDMPFASSTVSASILVGLFTIPALLYILQIIYQ